MNALAPVRVSEPGIYPDITPAQYHADPVAAPSLSASVAIALIAKTPFHAWLKHPRLNAEWRAELGLDEVETSAASRFGSLAHELLLGRGQGIHVIQARTKDGAPVSDYRTKAAQEERDAALAQGATPCLECELERAEEIVECIRGGLQRIPGAERAFDPASDPIGAELTAIWREPSLDVWGRILVDWWARDGEVWDLKTTGGGLSDEEIRRKIANDHLDLRCAWYERGIVRLRPDLAGRTRVNLVLVENRPPYEMRVVRVGPASLAMGHRKVAVALDRWAACLRSGQWPGYPREIVRLDLPVYAEKTWLDREESDPVVQEALQRDPFVMPSPEHRRSDQLTEFVP